MKYVVIGTPTCGFCKQAKTVLEQKNLAYEYKCLTEIAPAEQDRLMKVAKKVFRTVPQIFTVEDEDWKYIGGFQDLKECLG